VPERVQLRARESAELRCSLCHDEGERLAACPRCSTRFHEECRVFVARCPTLGCELRAGPAPPPRPAPRPFPWARAGVVTLGSAILTADLALAGLVASEGSAVPVALAAALHVLVTPLLIVPRARPDHRITDRFATVQRPLWVAAIALLVLAVLAFGSVPAAAVLSVAAWFVAPAIIAFLAHDPERDGRARRG